MRDASTTENTHKGYLPKGPYPPCLRMTDRALLAGYPRHLVSTGQPDNTEWLPGLQKFKWFWKIHLCVDSFFTNKMNCYGKIMVFRTCNFIKLHIHALLAVIPCWWKGPSEEMFGAFNLDASKLRHKIAIKSRKQIIARIRYQWLGIKILYDNYPVIRPEFEELCQ